MTLADLEGIAAEDLAPDLAFFAWPTLEQLSKATEEALREAGFGYRRAPHLSDNIRLAPGKSSYVLRGH